MAGKRQEGFVTINGVSTQVFTWGGWLEDGVKDSKEVVIFIPGSPGILGYYNSFLERLHSQLGIPIWAVSFAGVAIPPPGTTPGMPPLHRNNHLYHLQGQIKHKKEFIEKFVPEGVKVTIVAHSIGSKMTIEALKNSSIRSKVKKAYLLFPVLERLLETPNASVLRYAIWLKFPILYTIIGIIVLWLFNLLPYKLREFIVSTTLKIQGIPCEHTAATLQYAQLNVTRTVSSLGYDKMKLVRELDDEALRQFSDILFLYYGANDEWVPSSYVKEMQEKHPEVQFMVCEHGLDHAFCLNEGEKMADILVGLIKSHQTAE